VGRGGGGRGGGGGEALRGRIEWTEKEADGQGWWGRAKGRFVYGGNEVDFDILTA
jgi:hypothetical protein